MYFDILNIMVGLDFSKNYHGSCYKNCRVWLSGTVGQSDDQAIVDLTTKFEPGVHKILGINQLRWRGRDARLWCILPSLIYNTLGISASMVLDVFCFLCFFSKSYRSKDKTAIVYSRFLNQI